MSDPSPSLPVQSLANKINAFIWGVSATVTGSFLVALLYKSGMMELATTACLSWLAVVAAISAAIFFVGRSSADLTTP
jgi:hypothetical protein